MTIENEKDRAYRILVDNALSGPGCIMRPDSYQRLLILGMEQHRVAIEEILPTVGKEVSMASLLHKIAEP